MSNARNVNRLMNLNINVLLRPAKMVTIRTGMLSQYAALALLDESA
jgi:hypothetical protein